MAGFELSLASVLCAVLMARANVVYGAPVRGLNPEFQSKYTGSGGTFTCLDGSKTIPFNRVNDDYCDCPDGSDEPGQMMGASLFEPLLHTDEGGHRLSSNASDCPSINLQLKFWPLQAPLPATMAGYTATMSATRPSSSQPLSWTMAFAVC